MDCYCAYGCAEASCLELGHGHRIEIPLRTVRGPKRCGWCAQTAVAGLNRLQIRCRANLKELASCSARPVVRFKAHRDRARAAARQTPTRRRGGQKTTVSTLLSA
jgi:hypothetical protein